MDIDHVYPKNDLIEHNLSDTLDGNYMCPCDPKIDLKSGVIIHESLDIREVFE